MSKLKINVGLRQRKVRHPQGYRGGLENLRKSVTALVTHERIELNENRAVTVRQYTEKLISDAILYGDKHKHTMEMAQWWLEEVSATYYIIHNYQLCTYAIRLCGAVSKHNHTSQWYFKFTLV